MTTNHTKDDFKETFDNYRDADVPQRDHTCLKIAVKRRQ